MIRYEIKEVLRSSIDLDDMRFKQVKELMRVVEEEFCNHTDLRFEVHYGNDYLGSHDLDIVGNRLESDEEFKIRKKSIARRKREEEIKKEKKEYENYLKLKAKYDKEA